MVTIKHAISVWRQFGISILRGANAARDLRSGLFDLAYWLDEHPDRKGLLVLPGTRLSRDGIQKELERARRVIRSGLIENIEILALAGSDSLPSAVARLGLPEKQSRGLREHIEKRLEETRRRRIPQRAHDVVFECLVNRWLIGQGPMTTESLMEAAGFSYPPVAKALDELGSHIRRYSDRRVELHTFPREEWRRYISQLERSGRSRRYLFPEGLSRSPESMLERLDRLDHKKVAISGVPAARHFHPDLDLVGIPRLDLAVHCPSGDIDLDWVRKLDAALEPAASGTRSPHLVIWPVYRVEPMFQIDALGRRWADPVGCLVALHDARLESQASELLGAFESATVSTGLSEAG